MTTREIHAKLDEIDEQNSRMAGLVAAVCIGLISTSGIALYYALSVIPS